MSDLDNKVTIKSLLVFIHNGLTDFLSRDNYSKKEIDRLRELGGAIQVLMDLATDKEDKLIYEVTDELDYAVNHLGLANFKAEIGLKNAKEKIDKLK